MCLAAWLASLAAAIGSSILPHSAEDQVKAAGAIFEGVVASVESSKSPFGVITTRAVIQVSHTYKGRAPQGVELRYRGGVVDGEAQFDGGSPVLVVGQQRLFFVTRQRDGTLTTLYGAVGSVPLPGLQRMAFAPGSMSEDWRQRLLRLTAAGVLAGDDITDRAVTLELSSLSHFDAPAAAPVKLQASSQATNLFSGADGLSSRFLQPDRAEPIPVFIDADYLPQGLTREQGLQAVLTALAAWADASSLRFHFAGFESFGMAAGNITLSDGALRIQLHDHYGLITGGGETLGRGGSRWSIKNLESAGWTLGGNVQGNDFHKSVSGWVVIQHASESMRNVTNLTEVLCHEIGHALSLGHSSNDQNETNPGLTEALMYYMAHAAGRGAALRAYDTNVISQAYPRGNTAPYCHERVMHVVTSPDPLPPDANTLRLVGYDLQHQSATLSTTGETSLTGAFSFSNSSARFVPARFTNGPLLDPAGNSYYDMFFYRFTDGINSSPYAMVKVIALQPDSYKQGIPDAWRTTYFGSPNPNVPGRRADQDFDQDGFTNLEEYRLGSDPTSAASNLRASLVDPSHLTWNATPYALYEIYSSSNLEDWELSAAVVSDTSAPAVPLPESGHSNRFYRIEKVR